MPSIKDGIENGNEIFIQELEKMLGEAFPLSMRENYLRNDLRAMFAATQMMDWKDDSDGIKSTNVPCLLFIGEQDLYCENLVKYIKTCPDNVELVILDKTSHAQSYWNSNIACDLIIKFLELKDSI